MADTDANTKRGHGVPQVLRWNWNHGYRLAFPEPQACWQKCRTPDDEQGLFELVEWLLRASRGDFVPEDSLRATLDRDGREIQIHIEQSSNGAAFFGFAYDRVEDAIHMMGFWLRSDAGGESEFIAAARLEFGPQMSR
jgi:hypothetical protein